MLNPKTALLFFIFNILLLIVRLYIWIIVKFSISVFPNMQSYSILGIIELTLTTAVFIGLIAVLIRYHESKAISSSLGIYFSFQTYLVVNSIMVNNGHTSFIEWNNWLLYIFITILICVFFTLLVVKSDDIKLYYRYFGILSIIGYALNRILPILYDNFGLTEVLISPVLINSLPFFASLLLFKKLASTVAT